MVGRKRRIRSVKKDDLFKKNTMNSNDNFKSGLVFNISNKCLIYFPEYPSREHSICRVDTLLLLDYSSYKLKSTILSYRALSSLKLSEM